MNRLIKISKIISYSSLGIALFIGGTALFLTWRLYAQLPPGVCPLTTYRPWIYLALALALISLAASYVETTATKKDKRQEEADITDDTQGMA